MNRFLSVSLALVLIAVLSGCGGGGNSDTPAESYSVAGKIVDAAGNPVASVALKVGDAQIATTGIDGTFTLTPLEGQVTLTPALANRTFSPESRSISGEASGLTFMVDPKPVVSLNEYSANFGIWLEGTTAL